MFWTRSEFHTETLSRPLQASIQGQSQTCLRLCTGLPSNIAQIVCSYCHRDDTVQNVIQCASNQTEFAKIFITRKPTGEQGKLAVLRSHFSLSTALIHVDDSPEVLGEIQGFINEQGNTCNWRVVGISIRNKRQIPVSTIASTCAKHCNTSGKRPVWPDFALRGGKVDFRDCCLHSCSSNFQSKSIVL